MMMNALLTRKPLDLTLFRSTKLVGLDLVPEFGQLKGSKFRETPHVIGLGETLQMVKTSKGLVE